MIKKTFFDFWDHLIQIVLLNLGFLLVLTIPIFLPYTLSTINTPLALFTLVAGVLLAYIYLGAASMMTRDIADYGSPGFSDFFRYLRETWFSSLILGLISVLLFVVFSVAFPVYSAMNNFLGLAAMIFMFWGGVIWSLASLHWFPIRTRLDTDVRKIAKKSLILLFDNTMFTIVLGIGALVILFLSGFTAFLLPGAAGMLLWLNVGLKLRLYKYDYLEENPGANRKRIPWDALLIEDRERVGKRTLKGMIFPWKE